MAAKPSLLVVADFPFVYVGERFYAETPWDEAWARLYQPTFGLILLLGRCRESTAVPAGWMMIDATRYEVVDGGDWRGPIGFLGNLPRLIGAVRTAWNRAGVLYLKLFYLNSIAVWVFNQLQGRARKPVVTLLVGDSAEAVLIRDDLLPFAWMRRAASWVVTSVLRAVQRRVEVAGFWANFLERKFGTAGRASLVVLEPWFHASQIRVHDRQAPQTVPTILFVGRLIQRKRAQLLLQAVKLLKTEGIVVNVVLVGDGPERGSLENLVREDRKSVV